MRRQIVGVQVHHSTTLSDATRHGANLLTALEGAATRTTDPDVAAVAAELRPLLRQVGIVSQAARLRLQLHHADPDFKRYVDGDLPYPDENPDGFVARCRCHDRCLYHDTGRGTLERDCNCDLVCGQHD